MVMVTVYMGVALFATFYLGYAFGDWLATRARERQINQAIEVFEQVFQTERPKTDTRPN